MNELMKQSGKFFFVFLAIMVVGWTAWHSYMVLLAATGDSVQAVYGLITFEFGAIVWFTLFLRNAESMGQHVVALFGTVVGVVFVLVAFFMSMQMTSAEISRYGSVGRWLVVLSTAETLIFVLLYEMFSPKVWEALSDMIHDAMLHAKADKKAALMIEKESDELAEVIAKNRKERVFAKARISGIKPVPQSSDGRGEQRQGNPNGGFNQNQGGGNQGGQQFQRPQGQPQFQGQRPQQPQRPPENMSRPKPKEDGFFDKVKDGIGDLKDTLIPEKPKTRPAHFNAENLSTRGESYRVHGKGEGEDRRPLS